MFNKAPSMIEAVAAAALSVIMAWMAFTFMTHAGGLWRDEANGYNVATAPTLADAWRDLRKESFPALWMLLMRGWSAAGLARTDAGIRVLGFSIALLTIGSVWASARMVGLRYPVLALALISCSPSIMGCLAANRAYGLGLALVLPVLGLTWRYVSTGDRLSLALLLLFSMLSVQTLYLNVVCLAGILAGALVVVGRRQSSTQAAALLAIFVCACISLAPYHAVFAVRSSVGKVMPQAGGFDYVVNSFFEALGSGDRVSTFVWCVLIIAALIADLRLRGRDSHPANAGTAGTQSELAMFALTALLCATAGYLAVCTVQKVTLYPRYFVSVLGLTALTLDVGLWAATASAPMRLVAAAVALAAGFLPTVTAIRVRQTNVDLAAAAISSEAQPGDFIVVNPWEMAPSFARYYRGRAPWQTLPPTTDRRFEDYMALIPAVTARDPIGSVLRSVDEALGSGHRVYVVGGVAGIHADHPPPALPPADLDRGAVDHMSYQINWTEQLGYAIGQHRPSERRIPIAAGNTVSEYERVGVRVFEALPRSGK